MNSTLNLSTLTRARGGGYYPSALSFRARMGL
jgi:hypothetical protein